MQNTHFDPKEFRRTLGTFTTGVTIITTRTADGTPIGLTANSFNSVSLDPPMVLWSLAKTSRSLEAFTVAEHWAVHILAVDQESLSDRFAKSSEDKFAGVQVQSGIGDTPLLSGCSSRLQCKTLFQYEGGDHIIFVGEVLDFDRNEIPPLVFHAGNYAMAARKFGQAPISSVGQGVEIGDDFLGFLLPRAHYQIYARSRQEHLRHGLSDPEFFVLVSLIGRDGRSVWEIEQMFSATGHHITTDVVEKLAQRGLLSVDTDGLYLTFSGRELTLQIVAGLKAIESDILTRFGEWDAVALKMLLKQLVQITDINWPRMWNADAPSEDTKGV
ncbi:flavin reductase [Pseudomonas corrugata]|uniref:flavin reductase n=2 Tax=Pseudomonas corrugata TaxID=47879 RepID=UPI001586F0FE|nr:flavin reductase [Pseudomonas corrugata]NUT64707.1 flavin reductase [Pseudomonas corrugata]